MQLDGESKPRAVIFYKVWYDYYPSTQHNRACLDAYLQSGDEEHLYELETSGVFA